MTTKPSAPEPSRTPESSQPEIRIAYTPAGRETLDAITDELVPLPISVVVERESSSPEITVREGVIERDTLAAIMEEASAGPDTGRALVNVPTELSLSKAASPTGPTASATAATTALEIFEMVTYVVRGGDVARLASESLRRTFVEQHLLAGLPVKSMADVDRIDVTPWTVPGTLVVRVWCKTKPG